MMDNTKNPTETDILRDNLRICRMILGFTPGGGLLEQCRAALRENVREYDALMKSKELARKAAKKGE